MSNHKITGSQLIPIAGLNIAFGQTKSLGAFLDQLPKSPGLAFFIIVEDRISLEQKIIEFIKEKTGLPIIEVERRQVIKPNTIYLSAANSRLSFVRNKISSKRLNKNENSTALLDSIYRELSEAQADKSIAINLSGDLDSFLTATETVKEQGGTIILAQEAYRNTQSKEGEIRKAGVDLVIEAEKIPKILKNQYLTAQSSIHGIIKGEKDLDGILSIVQDFSNYDFRSYKRNTLVRRIERRISLLQLENVSQYLKILASSSTEVEMLYQDLLINVTGFFRENQVWENLKFEVLVDLVRNENEGLPLRIWVPGCSTGEEPYTIAILLYELFSMANKPFNAQIFATDIDEEAIRFARKGVFPEVITKQITADRLQRFFVKEEQGYRIIREVRENVVFAVQNLIGDAPFSNLDVVSCRNLLIYLEPSIQKKVIELFHFALRKNGFLVLGNSETIGLQSHLFEVLSKELRIYKSIGNHSHDRLKIPIVANNSRSVSRPTSLRSGSLNRSMAQLLQTQLIKRFAPAAVLINRKAEIIQFHGPTGEYLDLPHGEPVLELISMAKEGLRVKLRAAVHKATKSPDLQITSEARVKRNNHHYPVKISIRPVTEPDITEGLFVVTFEDLSLSEPLSSSVESKVGDDQIVRQLEAELLATRDDLQNTIEELEASNEDLKASNEEIMSMNEELQSSNEELETSKEELQSLNEELNTVNTQLYDKVSELEHTNNDLINLINSTDVATIFLNTNLSIRRFTPAAKRLFNLIDSDIGRPIEDLTRRFKDDDLKKDTQQVLSTNVPLTKEVETEDCHWYIRRILPFRIQDNKYDGLVLTFNDVTEIKKSLSEKEVLLQEVHHRVKNNMAVISSLLKLQAASENNDRISEILKECQDRVYTMSVVHETLYHSENLSEISFSTYLNKISQSLFHSYLSVPGNIDFKVDCEDFMVDIEKASPLGLVINELVSNSLKHAFPVESRGSITISAKKQSNETIKVSVSDDGVGLPEGFNWKQSDSLGLQLVYTLVVDQLDGQIDVETKEGTKFTFFLEL